MPAADADFVLETTRLRMRRLTHADLEQLYGFYLSPRFNRFVGGPPGEREPWIDAQRRRWSEHERDHGWGQWAVERKDDGRFVGRCGLVMQRIDGAPEVEVGYAFGEEFWGLGYAIEAARASRDWAFRELDVPHLISLIHADNTRSAAVAERNGMTVWKTALHRDVPHQVYRITRVEWERLPRGG